MGIRCNLSIFLESIKSASNAHNIPTFRLSGSVFSTSVCCHSVVRKEHSWWSALSPFGLCLPAPKQPTLAKAASEHWLSDVPGLSKNKHTHACAPIHPCTLTHVRAHVHTGTLTSSIIYTQVYLHANGPFQDNLITQRRLRPVCSFPRWEYRRGGMETSFCRANISLGLWKIPFKWSQAEKRQRICLAFCLTVFSAYAAVCFYFLFFFLDGTAHWRVLGTRMWWKGGLRGLIWWILGLFDCQSVCLSGCLSFSWHC